MTFQQMRDYVQKTIGLQGIDDYNELTLVDMWLNQGVIDLLARTRCIVRCVHLQTFAGEDTYTLDHSILSLVDVENGRWRKHRRDQGSWYPTLDPPELQGKHFDLIRSDVLRIPTPEEDGELEVWAVIRPQPMTDAAHSPGDEAYGAIPDEFQDAIVTYALWKGSDYADDASGSQGERYRGLYEGQDGSGGRLREIRKMINKRGTALAPRRRTTGLRTVSSRGSWVG